MRRVFWLSVAVVLALAVSVHGQLGTLAPVARQQFFNNSGVAFGGGYVCTYLAGTTTLTPTYTTALLDVPNGNPIILDGAGRATIFLVPGTAYKFVVASPGFPAGNCATATPLYEVDNIVSVPIPQTGLQVIGVMGEAVAVGNAVYLSDGQGGRTTGRWYLTDSDFTYSSRAPNMAIAREAKAAGESALLQLAGVASVFSGLSPGLSYFVSPTPGALTTTAPLTNGNVRRVGAAHNATDLVLGQDALPTAFPGTPSLETFVRGDTSAGQWALAFPHVMQGRLTLTTLIPVTVADVAGATTLYFTPYHGNRMTLFTGTVWTLMGFAQMSIAVPAGTNLYDVFMDYNAGAPQLVLTAWTNDTTRATNLALVGDGVWVKVGVPTQRYLGSMRTAAGATEDSLTKRWVYNYNQRVMRPLRVIDTTNSWNNSAATWGPANASTANSVSLVVGIAEETLGLTLQGAAAHTNAASTLSIGFGINSTTVPTAPQSLISTASTFYLPLTAGYAFIPPIGVSTITWLEYSSGATGTFYGDNGGNLLQSGLTGWIPM